MSHWPAAKARQVLAALLRSGWSIKRQSGTSHRVLARSGWPDYVFAFHDQEEIGPRMLARIARRPGSIRKTYSDEGSGKTGFAQQWRFQSQWRALNGATASPSLNWSGSRTSNRRQLLLIGGLAFDGKRDVLVAQGLQRGLGHQVFSRSQDVAGKAAQQRTPRPVFPWLGLEM